MLKLAVLGSLLSPHRPIQSSRVQRCLPTSWGRSAKADRADQQHDWQGWPCIYITQTSNDSIVPLESGVARWLAAVLAGAQPEEVTKEDVNHEHIRIDAARLGGGPQAPWRECQAEYRPTAEELLHVRKPAAKRQAGVEERRRGLAA
ncbi:hypothetical protein AOQ84DRAFT_220907, partial [Glonium stellatum]